MVVTLTEVVLVPDVVPVLDCDEVVRLGEEVVGLEGGFGDALLLEISQIRGDPVELPLLAEEDGPVGTLPPTTLPAGTSFLTR